MKAIKQLAVHFWRRGVISPLEAAYLVRHGFVRERDLPGFSPRPEVVEPEAQVVIEPPSPLEEAEEALEVRTARRRGRKPYGGVELKAEELCLVLEGEFARREKAFRPLVWLARATGLTACDDWRTAAAALRNVSDESLRRGLTEAARRGVTARHLSVALDLAPFHALAAQAGAGRAAQAFRALLADPKPAALGKYVWILHHAPARTVRNLVILGTRLPRFLSAAKR